MSKISVARLIAAPSQRYTDLIRKSLLRPETRSNRAAGSMAENSPTKKLRHRRANVDAAMESRAMHTIPASDTITRTIYPGTFEMPIVHELVRDDFGRACGFGEIVEIKHLTREQLDEMDAELDALDREFNQDLVRVRTAIDDARCHLDDPDETVVVTSEAA